MSSKITPILHYNFEEFTEDGKVKDLSGNGHHGTINGATRCEDMWGRANAAMSFDTLQSISFDEIALEADSFAVAIVCNVDIPDGNYSNVGHLFSRHSGRYINYIALSKTIPSMWGEGNINDYYILDWIQLNSSVLNNWHSIVVSSTTGSKTYVAIDGVDLYTGENDGIGMKLNSINNLATDAGFTGKVSATSIYEQGLTPTQAKKISFDMMRKVGRN